MKEKVLGTSAVSRNWQTAIIREVRPHLELKKGDRIRWILKDGDIVVRRVLEVGSAR